MHVLSKAAAVPLALGFCALTVVQVSQFQPQNSAITEAAVSLPTSETIIQYSSFRHPAELESSVEIKEEISQQTRSEFQLLTQAELQNLSQDALLNYMLDFRQQYLFETDFMAKEYELFQDVLEWEPFAALDYMISIGHDASSEFFYNFLYTDFMVHQGKSQEVVDYLNRFGPNVALLHLVTFANLADQISPQVQRDVLTEYRLGNVDYHNIIRSSGWDELLTRDEKISAFLNTVPEYVEDPYDLVTDIVKLNAPSTFPKLIEYIEKSPDRYRLYREMRQLTNLDLHFAIDQLMARRSDMPFDDQVQIALIALDYGHYEALAFLIESADKKPIMMQRPMNVEYAVMMAISTPDYVDKNIQWAAANLDALRFNQYSRKFEY